MPCRRHIPIRPATDAALFLGITRLLIDRGQYAAADPTRMPPGKEVAWAYTHVPQETRRDAGPDGIRGTWDHDDTERIADRIQARIEEYAPGFGDRVEYDQNLQSDSSGWELGVGTDFDERAWRHAAPWCDEAGRIEMRLYAERAQRVHVGTRRFEFAPGDYLLTEYSHKYRLEEFAALAASAGWRTRRVWTDAAEWFAVHLLEP